MQRSSQHSRQPGFRLRATASDAATHKLADLEMRPLLNLDGFVEPEVSPGAQAFVFAIHDVRSKLQYVGFSKDLRNSLRTLLTRRPDKAYTYKAASFNTLDQQAMLAQRDAWFAEVGGPPPGNKLAIERNMWQSPVDAGAISQRGKRGAADDKLRELLGALRARGCKEELVADEALLNDGQVDFLPAAAQSDADKAASAAARAANRRAMRTATAIVDGVARQFTVTYPLKLDTAGGCMLDVVMTYDHQESRHRIIVGREWYEPHSLPPEAVAEAALGLLLTHKQARNTDGLLTNSQFPVNYFAITELSQWYEDEWIEALETAAGHAVQLASAWRFDRTWPSMHWVDSPGDSQDGVPALGAAAQAV